VVGAGVPGVPRGCVRARWIREDETSQMVAAPLRYGHRSMPGGEERWQYTRVLDTAKLRHAIEQARHAVR
jgi:hypothetical protein